MNIMKTAILLAVLIVCLLSAAYAKKNKKKYQVHPKYDHCGTVCLRLYFKCVEIECKRATQDRCTEKCFRKLRRCPKKVCKQSKLKLSNKLKSRSTSRRRGGKRKKKTNKATINNTRSANS